MINSEMIDADHITIRKNCSPLDDVFQFTDIAWPVHAELGEWMRQDPERRIPLAFYVFLSSYRLKPVLVADFVKPGRPRAQEYTSALKLGLNNFFAVTRIPLFVTSLKRAADYGMNRKDASSFVTKSKVSGIESARLFARLGWNFDDVTNHLLLKAMEARTSNPLAGTFKRQAVAADGNLNALLDERDNDLGLFLRVLFENRIRPNSIWGIARFFRPTSKHTRSSGRYRRAASVIESFNDQVRIATP